MRVKPSGHGFLGVASWPAALICYAIVAVAQPAQEQGTHPAPPTAKGGEKYEKFDPPGAINLIMVSAPDDALSLVVKLFTIGGKEIELLTDRTAIEDNNRVISTKNFGKIRVVDDDNNVFGVTLWVTPSQKQELSKLVRLARAPQSPTPKTAPSSASTKKTEGTKQPAAEVYTKVEDPSALGLQIEVAATSMMATPNDDGAVNGKVTSLTVGGKPLALVSSEIVNDEKGSWVATKAYGRIRVSGAYSGGIMFWLTPLQRTSLKALYRAPK